MDPIHALMTHIWNPPPRAEGKEDEAASVNFFAIAAQRAAETANAATSSSLLRNTSAKGIAHFSLQQKPREEAEYLYKRVEAPVDPGAVLDHQRTLEEALLEVEEDQRRQMDVFASECAAREVAIRNHRQVARRQLELECQAKVSACDTKLEQALAKYRPSQGILDLRMKIRALGLSRRAVDYTEKGRLERDLLARESKEKERYRERCKVEHQVVSARIKLEVDRAKTRFDDESKVLQLDHAAAMEAEFEKLMKKFEARKTAIVVQHRNRTQGVSSQGLPSAALALRAHASATSASKRDPARGRTSLVPSLALPDGSDAGGGGEAGGSVLRSARSTSSRRKGAGAGTSTSTATTPRAARQREVPASNGARINHNNAALAPSRKGTEALIAVMKQVFGNVLEAFVFFDMEGADVVRAQQFRTQASRLLPELHPDSILAEVESFSANHGRQTQVLRGAHATPPACRAAFLAPQASTCTRLSSDPRAANNLRRCRCTSLSRTSPGVQRWTRPQRRRCTKLPSWRAQRSCATLSAGRQTSASAPSPSQIRHLRRVLRPRTSRKSSRITPRLQRRRTRARAPLDSRTRARCQRATRVLARRLLCVRVGTTVTLDVRDGMWSRRGLLPLLLWGRRKRGALSPCPGSVPRLAPLLMLPPGTLACPSAPLRRNLCTRRSARERACAWDP